jgi:hypothetical protein
VCGSWQPSHFWWPEGALACSFIWQLPHAGAAAGAWAEVPWHVAQSAWPWFVDAALASAAWQFAHKPGFDGGVKSWPWWQATQLAPWCTPVSTWATFAWQVVQAATFASGSPCGTWQPVHAPWSACVTCTVAWHPWHEVAAAAGACGVWQLVQTPWAGARSAASVGFIP